MKKVFLTAGLISGISTWAALKLIPYLPEDHSVGNPIFSYISLIPGIVFGLVVGSVIYLCKIEGKKLKPSVVFILWSTFAYCAAYNTAFWTALGNVWPGPKELSIYISFFVAGLLGSFLLALFLKVFYKISLGNMTRIAIWGAVLGVVGYFLDGKFNTGINKRNFCLPLRLLFGRPA